MAEGNSMHKIDNIRRRWIVYRIAADTMLCLAVAIAAGSVMHFVFGWTILIAVLLFILGFIITLFIRNSWKVQTAQVIALLDRTYPQLEESSALVIKSASGLNLLERLQLYKVENALQSVPGTPPQFGAALKRPAFALLAAVIICLVMSYAPLRLQSAFSKITGSAVNGIKNLPPEKVLPAISSVELKITPPAYTGRSPHSQGKFTIDAEEGSAVSWLLETNTAVKKISLVFDERQSVSMLPAGDRRHWSVSKTLLSPGFYQVDIDGKRSDLYAISLVKDTPPAIRIISPKQYTHIEAGQQLFVNLTVNVNDDYGVAGATIGATVAKGTGEAVKFKEYKLSFAESFGGHNREYHLTRSLDLAKLDMAPGDELYFYIQATDTHKQVSKTDVYIVSIQDTAALLSMDGIVSGVNLKPEFFRSERQIIIDSQKLLHDRDSIGKTEFNKRSNELATDQKLLRLRYGKFLGEEDESSIGQEASSDLGKAENFSNANKIMDAYTDKHDNAEDATFLEPTAKAQLKATLTEMWKAELQLRLYKPQEALPFEFKALTLLKDLQQKSRSYVAKTGYKTTPLKPEKRLTGDLSKIMQPVTYQDAKKQADDFAVLQKALMILEQLKTDIKPVPADKHTLQLAAQQLGARAGADPRFYLSAVTAFRKILAGNAAPAAIAHAEKGIQKILPQPQQMPSSSAGTDFGLSQGYFKNLSKLNR